MRLHLRPGSSSSSSLTCASLFSPLFVPLKPFPSSSSFLLNCRPKRLSVLRPCSSLRETKKETIHKVSNAPPNLRVEKVHNREEEIDGDSESETDGTNDGIGENGEEIEGKNGGFEKETALKGTILAGLLLVGVVGGFGTVGYIYKDQVNAFLNQFSVFIEGYGPAGYALFVAVYAGLEVKSATAAMLLGFKFRVLF